MALPSAPGATLLTTLTGNELVPVIGVGPQSMVAKVSLIASAGSSFTNDTPTAVTTIGNGTLTAAALLSGVINRTGPVAAYTDTTSTAALIYAAVGSTSGLGFYVWIKNGTAFTETLAGGTGVTFSQTSPVIPANSAGLYLVTITSATAAVFNHVITVPLSDVGPEIITTLSTVGAGTILAAAIAGGVISRTGAQSASPFTDTTDTAALIIAARSNAHIGDSWEVTYVNTTNAVATIAGGTGVTPSGITVIPAGDAVRYLVTYTAAATITMVAIAVSQASTSWQSIILAGSTSGTTTLVASATAGSTTATFPPVSGTVAETTGSNLFVTDVYRTSSAVTKNANVTPATVTGLSGAIAVGTYRFRAVLPSTVASGTGGIAYNFLLTTAVLGVMEATGLGYTSAAVAVQHTTTATSGTALFTQAAVVIMTIVEGTFTCTTAGTFAIQMAQNTSNASDTVALVGGTLELCRIV